MSINAINAVFAGTQHSGFELAMMLTIANHADHHGHAWAYMDTLADRCRITTEHACEVIDALKKSGELEVTDEPPFKGFIQMASCYRITIMDCPVRVIRKGGAA